MVGWVVVSLSEKRKTGGKAAFYSLVIGGWIEGSFGNIVKVFYLFFWINHLDENIK